MAADSRRKAYKERWACNGVNVGRKRGRRMETTGLMNQEFCICRIGGEEEEDGE